jgi:hypothetical protein
MFERSSAFVLFLGRRGACLPVLITTLSAFVPKLMGAAAPSSKHTQECTPQDLAHAHNIV